MATMQHRVKAHGFENETFKLALRATKQLISFLFQVYDKESVAVLSATSTCFCMQASQ